MKRTVNILIFVVTLVLFTISLSGCHLLNEESLKVYMELQLDESYELVAARVEDSQRLNGNFSGMFLFGFGNVSGSISSNSITSYHFWYKRADGGIIPDSINLQTYNRPEQFEIVIYEDDTVTPKYEIWRNEAAKEGNTVYARTEYRFTIPSGTFVSTFDFQGLNENNG